VAAILALLLVLLGGCATAPAAAASEVPAVQPGPPVWLLLALVGIGALLAVVAVQVTGGGP